MKWRSRDVEAGPRNPFLPHVEEAAPVEQLETDPIIGDRVEAAGLSGPAAGGDVPPAAAARPAPTITDASVWLVGASGGVGVSTLAALADDHVIDGGEFVPPAGSPVFVVGTTHAAGLEKLRLVAQRLARNELPMRVLGVIIVHDRPRISPPTARAARGIAALFPRAFIIPYMSDWREIDAPHRPNVRITRVLGKLHNNKEIKK